MARDSRTRSPLVSLGRRIRGRRPPAWLPLAAAALMLALSLVSFSWAAPVARPAAHAPAARAIVAQPAATSLGGAPRFMNYVSPVGVGDGAGEPSIGSNWTTEQVFTNSSGLPKPNGGSANYFGGFFPYMLKVTFDDCQSPALVTWDQKALLTANSPRLYGDPILFTDHATGRTFVSQLEGLTPAGSTTDITDDDGAHFSPSQGGSQPSCVDHQTFGGGPFHAPLTGTTVYPNAIYYASQCISDAVCAVSLDGGLTFGPSVPMYTIADCDGLHGHVKVAPDGTVYVPNKGCGAITGSVFKASVVVSENNGATWSIRNVPDGSSLEEWDPSVGIATDGTIYLGYQGGDGHARIAVSHDKGLTWSPSVDVGMPAANVQTDTPEGIHNMVFPEVVAGDRDRAAFAFYGTTTADGPGEDHTGGSNDDPSLFSGVWYLYVATTYDGGATWQTQNVTPGDPIQRGPICHNGGCRNMLDFMDITIDKEGRILIGWDDGCIDGCVSALPNSNTSKATITRQCGGRRMLAAFDPAEPAVPEAPALQGNVSDATAHLSWLPPDDGGSAITGYHLYRRVGTSGSFTSLGTVTGTSFTDTVDPTQQTFYRLTAVNSLGEGPYCSDFLPSSGPGPTPCVLPGLLAVNDLNADGSDNDSGQNTPPDPSVNIRSLFLAEPYLGQGVNEAVFTLQMTPSSSGIAPPSSQWYIVWNRQTIAADGSDRRFVAMKTDATGATSFDYGNFGPPLPLDGSVPPANANTPEPLGAADAGSYDPASGVITIRLATSKLDDTALVPGDHLQALNVRTYLARPDAGQKSQNNASDITVNGDYVLVGNASCFCTVAQAPIAGLSASPASGTAPLTVQFNAGSSVDPDAGDAVGTYTFDFGDGTSPVTQTGPLATHTYTAASGPAGYLATLTVNDALCGKKSANIASQEIVVSGTTAVEDGEQRPRVFRITPASNPAKDGTTFALDMIRDGMVSVQLFDPDGRRVAEVANSWMPAGRHAFPWSGTGAGGRQLAAGVYLVRAKWGGHQALSRLVLIH